MNVCVFSWLVLLHASLVGLFCDSLFFKQLFYLIIIIIIMKDEGDVISIVIGALGTIPRGLMKRLKDLEIKGRAKTIYTTELLILT